MTEKKIKLRRIRVPSEEIRIPMIAGRPDGPKQIYPFGFFMEWLLNIAPMLNKSQQGGRWASNIDHAYRERKSDGEGEYFDLEQAPQPQWPALAQGAKDPGQIYPIPSRYLGPYLDAITEAEEVESEEEAEE